MIDLVSSINEENSQQLQMFCPRIVPVIWDNSCNKQYVIEE